MKHIDYWLLSLLTNTMQKMAWMYDIPSQQEEDRLQL